jgi:hypothetical protein
VPRGQINIVFATEKTDTSKLKTQLDKFFPDRKDKIQDEQGRLLAGNFHIRIY